MNFIIEYSRKTEPSLCVKNTARHEGKKNARKYFQILQNCITFAKR
jgi:hypothetical protein